MGMSTLARPLVLGMALALGAPPAVAQSTLLDQSLAHRATVLESRLGSRPTPRDRCELGFIYHRQGRNDEARGVLDQGLAELGAPTGVADRRTLAACLYSRGRVAEAAGDVAHARRFYARSLELRDARETRERVAALSVTHWADAIPASRPPSALSPEESAAARYSLPDGTVIAWVVDRPTSPGAERWALVATAGEVPQEEVSLSAVACDAGGCHADTLQGNVTYGSYGTFELRSAVVIDGSPPVLEIRTHETAYEHDGPDTAIDTVDFDGVYFCSFTGGTVTCGCAPTYDRMQRSPSHFDVAYAAGRVTLHRISGRLRPDFPIPLDRPVAIEALPTWVGPRQAE